MKQNRFLRHGTFQHPEPRFGRLLLVSLALHLLVAAVSFFDILPDSRLPQKQTYYVDLVNMPVKSPQAGRPDAAAEPKKTAKPEPAEKPAVQKSAPAKEKTVKKKAPEKEPPVAEKPKPEPKPEPKPKPEPEPEPEPEPKPDRYQETLSAIEKLRQKKQRDDEIAAYKKKIEAFTDTRGESDVRGDLGSPEGTGTEKGASYDEYLREYLKQRWRLSQYQVSSLDLEAKVELSYDAQGNLIDYRFVEKSGDKFFDDSLKKTILKGNPLPFEPGERWSTTVTFNLKDLRD